MSNQINLQTLMQSAGMAVKQSRDALDAAQHISGRIVGVEQELQRMAQNAQQLRDAISRVNMVKQGGDPGIQRVENIPGRRIPFDLLVDIPIGANVTSVQQGTILISQEGPFVAVGRYATLLSTLEFQFRAPGGGAVTTFQGRSFGRYRPIHSAWDLGDGRPYSEVSQLVAFPGTGAPSIASPSNQASFRTMEGDFRILLQNAGSSFPRSNIEVPSAFWSQSINAPFALGALDVFERGEVISINVLPLHQNNPPFGNVFGFGAPNPNYPFADSQWDCTEGIADPNDPAALDQDPVSRLPNAILTIGLFGYRIVQPAGAGPY